MGVPGNANTLLLKSAAAGGGAYQVSRSLRFNAGDSAYLNRTPASAGNRRTWTWAGWVKRSELGGNPGIFASSLASGPSISAIEFDSDLIRVYDLQGGTYDFDTNTLARFRDASAWYHILIAVDTTAATAANRVLIYVNGILQPRTNSNPSLNFNTQVNVSKTHYIGFSISTRYFSGYLADVHFIDGQALTPSSFTETNATTGQLIPKAYSGSYGTNGFKLDFSNNSTTAALGTDTSGNGNTWTVNNLSVTAGSGNDSLVDTPTSYGTDTGVGGEVRGNYCTWSPLYGSTPALSNGNLDATTSATTAYGSISVTSGKWYWEITVSTASYLGVIDSTYIKTDNSWSNQLLAYQSNGNKYNGSSSAYGAFYTNNDVIGVALDMDAGTIAFYKNGSSQGTAFSSGVAGKELRPMVYSASSGIQTANFGQRPFAYTAPSGFKALCDTNLPTPVVTKPNTVMDVKLYTGNGSTQTISGLNFDSDLLWIKRRNGANSHQLTDTVRGLTKYLFSDATLAEETRADQVTATSSTGFSLGSNAAVNASAGSYVAWAWDAGTSTVTNTAGSISSQVRANASAGFSIVTYTGNGVDGATIGHGLGVTPGMVIVKNRDNGNTFWPVAHRSIANGSVVALNSTNATMDHTVLTRGVINNLNSTTFAAKAGTFSNESANGNGEKCVAYAFAPVSGYSSFGSYTGNGSADGPFVYTGFRPKYIMYKGSSIAGSWDIRDTSRSTYNTDDLELYANLSQAEASSAVYIDVLSNGFKIRNSNASYNGSGATYIYAAFAESPFQFSRAR
jgi:hypothetical protein